MDGSGNVAVLTLPAPRAVGSLSANRDLVIDGEAPSISFVSVNSDTLTLLYNSILDDTLPPTNNDFNISGGHIITSVSISGSSVILTFSP